MADLTLCSNTQCPRALTCYRVTAIPNEQMQSVQHFEYRLDNDAVSCGFYYPVRSGHLVDEGYR